MSFFYPLPVHTAELTLAWDPNSEHALIGYKLYIGAAPRTYANVIDVGNVTQYTLTGLSEGQTYFIAATAYDGSGNESAYSNEASGIATETLRTATITTNPSGLQIAVDGSTYSTPHVFNWKEDSTHVVSILGIQRDSSSSKKQYVFDSWNDGETQNRMITATASNMTYVANFKTQYSLTTTANLAEGGRVIPTGTTWYDAGQTVSITTQASQGYRFSNWSGDIISTHSSTALEMDKSKSLVAHFRIGADFAASREMTMVQATTTRKPLPLVGDLESPSEGKKVSGVKTIYGWALDAEGVQKIELLIDGNYVCGIPYGGMREDVAQAHPDYPNADRSGFALIWNYSSLSAGRHIASVKIWNLRREVLELSATIFVYKFQGEFVTQAVPNEWVIPDVKITADGKVETYDLVIEWVNESQSFEVSEILPK